MNPTGQTPPTPSPHTSSGASFSFGCDGCPVTDQTVCEDCIVTHLCGPVVVRLDELRAIKALQAGGLLPDHRHPHSAVP